ncbi:MAG: hypothetical protein R3F39_21885 [Myxococcota bacterium]
MSTELEQVDPEQEETEVQGAAAVEEATPYPGEGLVRAIKKKIGGSSKKKKEAERTEETTATTTPTTGGSTPPSGGGGTTTAPSGGSPAPTGPAPEPVVTAGPPTLAEALAAAVTANKLADALTLITPDVAAGLTALGTNKAAFMTMVKDAKPYTTIRRAQLTTLFNGATFDDKKSIFEARFSITISGEGSGSFTENELNTLHAQCVTLPPGHVEGLGTFTELRRSLNTATAEGTHGGSTITMRDEADATRYSQVFRHEVGHAVDASLGGACETLRSTQAGWTRYNTVDEFIAAAGGYGTIPSGMRAVAKAALESFIAGGGPWNGPASFDAALEAAVMAAHPEVTATESDGSDAVSVDLAALRPLLASNTLFKTAVACQGPDFFYGNAAQAAWPQTGGKAFFFNFYYHKAFSVGQATHDDLKAWGNAAAGFSDKEWFAEIYASWYETSTPGSSRTFPAFVTTFMNNTVANVGGPGAGAPSGGGGNPKVPH